MSLQALVNLLLTGRASPHVFNGTVYLEDDSPPAERPLQGILSRSDVGYLHWSREQMERDTLPQVDSFSCYYYSSCSGGIICVAVIVDITVSGFTHCNSTRSNHTPTGTCVYTRVSSR